MTLLAGVDRRALLSSLLVAASAFILLALLVDRLGRLAQAQPIGADRHWAAPAGSELRLAGIAPGPLLAIESTAGGRLTIEAEPASLADGKRARRLLWMMRGGEQGDDNKPAIQIHVVDSAPGGTVVLSRAGESVAPQLRIEARGVTLRAEAGVTVGEALFMPDVVIEADEKPVEPTGPVFAFAVPSGGSMSVGFPYFPDGTQSGVQTWIGPVRGRRDELALTRIGIAPEGAGGADKAACGAPAGRYAFGLFLRPALAPAPGGRDCVPGQLRATSLSIGRDSVGLDLAGSAFVTAGGKPNASIWSWAMSNPVLEIAINKLLPLAVSAIFGFVTFRRRSAAAERAKAGAKLRRKRKPKALPAAL